ncbi:MAG: hypothetical protein RL215_528 [Planctomycetota bacterium]|jgi:hypothetical protein
MKRLQKLAIGVLLVGGGFVAGQLTATTVPQLQAGQDESSKYGLDVLQAYRQLSKAGRELGSLLTAGGNLTSVTTATNYFGMSVGGVNAELDLEEGRGVDPETFAALYADLATPKVAEHLDYDEQGRLRYKKTVIRMYSRERLRALFNERDELTVRSETAN